MMTQYIVEIPITGIPLTSITAEDLENVEMEILEDELADAGDFIDEGLEEEDNIAGGSQAKSGRRGPDLPWEEYLEFKTIEDFKSSDVATELESFSRRSGKETSTETFVCKFLRKKGYN